MVEICPSTSISVPFKLRDTAEFRGIISCFWVAMAMASLWMPPLSSQLASMSICLPHRKCAGGMLRMNFADRRGGCPLLVVRASAMDAATELSTGAKDEIRYRNEAGSGMARILLKFRKRGRRITVDEPCM